MIASQHAGKDGLYLCCRGGREITRTAAQLKAIYQATKAGLPSARSQAALAALQAQIVAALGPENYDPTAATIDVDWATGWVRELTLVR